MYVIVIWGLMVGLLSWANSSDAACTGSSPTWTSTPDRASVNTCVSTAASGDTINVSAGTASWSSPIPLPSGKDLTLNGTTVVSCSGTEGTNAYSCAATDNLTLTCPSGCFEFDVGTNHRITGFTMTNAATDEIITCVGNANATKHFRIDHNHLISTGGWNPTRCKGGSNGVHPQGIWDHNRVEGGVAIHTNGTLHMLSESTAQHVIWAEETPLGNSSKVVYVEANHFIIPSGGTTNFTDGNYGGRVVIRFNKGEGSATTNYEFHSPQGSNRGFQRWEVYNNNSHNQGTGTACFHGMVSIRGGTGVLFNNNVTGTFDADCNYDSLLDNVRSTWSAGSSVDGVRACDGGSPWDQNTSGQQGWHCRDQIGTARDLSQWNHSTTPAWNQEAKPAYFWGNTKGTGALNIIVDSNNRNELHIQWNRDAYKSNGASCSGSSCSTGVGSGPIGTRPANCATGTAYWATDEGEWNSTNGSTPDGRLYKCTSTNTWSLYYTPYPYPHPWVAGGGGEGDVTPPSAPTNLRVQ